MPRQSASNIKINRAPVLTLWATVVAEHLGYEEGEALTLGRAIAGYNAQSKGRKLGIYKTPDEETRQEKEKEKPEKEQTVKFFGRTIPIRKTKSGMRAAIDRKPISSHSVRAYLEQKFGDQLEPVRKAMNELADAFDPKDLAASAYRLYEEFRPEIPEGTRGWGAAGVLSLRKIRSLAE